MPEKKNSEMMISAEAQKGSNIPQKTNKPSKDAAKVRAKRQVRASDMHAVRSIQVVSVKKSDKKPFPWAVVFVALILTAMFLFMMMNYAEVDKYRSEIADLDSKIESMQKTQGNLEVALSSKYNLNDIKEYAESELGMVPKEQLPSHRITVDQDDRIEMNNKEEEQEEGGVGFLLSGLAEVWRDFFNRSK